jgi:hypothetical protein
MIETILLAMLISKIKGYKLRPLFKSWAFYPVLLFTLIYIFLQFLIFSGDYRFVKYSGLLETIYILAFLPLIFAHRLYGSAIKGSLSIMIGTALNKLAIVANRGKMPVFPTLSYITGYAKPESFTLVNDIHVLGSEATKLKLLTDYIDFGYSILSIGDIFIRFFTFIIIFNSIRYITKQNIEIKYLGGRKTC